MTARAFAFLLLIACVGKTQAQRLDSVHVFRAALGTKCTTAKAEANAWKCQRSRTSYLSIAGSEVQAINEALSTAKLDKHKPGQLEVAGLGFGYAKGAMHAFAITAGAEKVIDLTTRREFVLTGLSDRLKLKALLLTLGL